MELLPTELIVLGGLLLLALAAEAVGRRTRIPRISLLVLLGFVLGPAAIGVIDPRSNPSFDLIALLALSMVGFLVGGKLHRKVLRRSGSLIWRVSLTQTFGTFVVVGGGLLLIGFPPALALSLGAIATATDPAATADVVKESRTKGRYPEVLLGVVAVDDAWGLILFAIAVSLVQAGTAAGVDGSILGHGLSQLISALLLGIGLGVPTAKLSGRVRQGEPTLMEAAGIVMLCAGLAEWLDISPLLSCVALGVTVSNLAKHHKRPFHALEEIEWPFLAVFFLFSGAYLTLPALAAAGSLLLIYIVLRVLGRLGGGLLLPGGDANARATRWMGLALLPQAGVAIAMTFEACSLFPEIEAAILPTVITATVIFEVIGPLLTRWSLRRAGRVA